ncbi:MAG: hypothetical protein ACRYHQ_26735, partial [Janthinobacterium lividum]
MQIPILPTHVPARDLHGGTVGRARAHRLQPVRDQLAFGLVVGLWLMLAVLGSGIALVLSVVLPRRRHALVGRRLLRLGARAGLSVAQAAG